MSSQIDGRPLSAVAGGAISIRLMGLVSTIAFVSITSFVLPAGDFGQLSALLSLVLFVGVAGEFGQRDLATREISKHIAGNNDKAVHIDSQKAATIALAFGSVCGFLVAVFYALLGANVVLICCAGLISAMLSFNGVLSGIGRAQGALFWAIGPREILWRVFAMLIFFSTFLLGMQPSVETATVSLFLSLIICVGIQTFQLKLLPIVFELSNGRWSQVVSPSQLKTSFDLMIVNIAGQILVSLDVVAVGLLLGHEEAAQYFPGNRIAILVIYFQVALNLSIAPKLAREFAHNRHHNALELCQNTTKLALMVSGAVFVLIMSSQPYLPILFGTATHETWIVAVILSIGHLATVATGFGGTALVAAGREQSVRKIMVWSVPLSLAALSFVGLIGDLVQVAVVVAIASLLRALIVARTCRNLLGGSAAIV